MSKTACGLVNHLNVEFLADILRRIPNLPLVLLVIGSSLFKQLFAIRRPDQGNIELIYITAATEQKVDFTVPAKDEIL
ncbi:hypothetical protein D3C81_1874560 [compost metagenome]